MPLVRATSFRPSSLRATLALKDPRLPRGKDFNGKLFDGLHYAQVRGSVFVRGISPTDVAQGNLGDCFFLSSLVAVANTKPGLLKRAMGVNADGTYTVTFKQRKNGVVKDVPITVTGDFPAARRGGQTFARGLDRTKKGPELWPAIYEKAYAVHAKGYSTINQGGYAEDALLSITGNRASRRSVGVLSGPKLWSTLVEATRAGKPIVTGTHAYGDLKRGAGDGSLGGLIDAHAYALLGVHESNGTRYVDLYTPLTPEGGGNPAGGKKRALTLPFEQYRTLFDDLIIGAV